MRIGRVVSDSMDNTVVVAVERIVAHPLYGRRMKRTQRFMAHNEDNQARVGDRVRLMETRPLSKRKRWRVVEILERAK
ncbi:MAG TPA: 30S ribosomal protein S17 [Firmicutes bacterium]|jgi:small subunit ribosomal protein S17|nr:30S ribosomal protein S17 [Bacillota bacterium]